MNTITCAQCGGAFGGPTPLCPYCGAPHAFATPALAPGYEWKSRWTWLGAPVLHIAFGADEEGKLRTARGLVAVGQRAVGGLSFGIIASGFISCGIVSCGVISFGVISFAAVAAVGLNAFGPIAYGVTAVGYYAGGLAPLGWKALAPF